MHNKKNRFAYKEMLNIKEINTFIQQGCIKIIKSDYLFMILQMFLLQINPVRSKNAEKSNVSWFPQKYWTA